MPDIAMCASGCAKQDTCKRHPASGTKSSQYQSWFDPALSIGYDEKNGCDYFWGPKPPLKDGTATVFTHGSTG